MIIILSKTNTSKPENKSTETLKKFIKIWQQFNGDFGKISGEVKKITVQLP